MSSEVGPSRPQSTGQIPKNRKRKAGGEGKKGKVFLEDKAGLLDLIGSVTDSKDSVIASRLAKVKAGQVQSEPLKSGSEKRADGGLRNNEESPPTGNGGAGDEKRGRNVKSEPKVLKASERKQREKARALLEAKASVLAEEKEKKRRKKEGPGEATTPTTKEKRVGFA